MLRKAWPSVKDEQGFTNRMDNLPKYLISSNLEIKWNNSHPIEGDSEKKWRRSKKCLGKNIEEVQLGRCSTSLRAGPEANVDSVPERSLFALTFSSSTLAIPTDLGWDTFPVNLDFALVTDVRLMPETFVAYDVGITSHITRSSEASSTNTCDLGLVSSRADCIAVRL